MITSIDDDDDDDDDFISKLESDVDVQIVASRLGLKASDFV